MRIAFRADASPAIGSGHVMRCLTLADAARRQGAATLFLCRHLPDGLARRVEAQGHGLLRLPAPDDPATDPGPPLAHADFLGVTQAEDAATCRAPLAAFGPDWIVVDHYGLDARWEAAVGVRAGAILAIDDLADREHDCALLLDQNLGRTAEDYRPLVPPGADILAGPAHALLRPEFAAARAASLAWRADRTGPLRINICMGGFDRDNVTGQVLDGLARADLPAETEIVAVLGGDAPHLEALLQKAATLPVKTRILADVTDMARLWSEADLAIGAAGTMAWERATLGLPTLLVVLAENQVPGTEALVRTGAAISAGQAGAADLPDRIAAAWPDARALRQMSRASAALTDGSGTATLLAAMFRQSALASLPRDVDTDLRIRAATAGDARAVFAWRRAGGADRYYRSKDQGDLDTHLSWFDRALRDTRRVLLIATRDGDPAGHLRFDLLPDPTGRIVAHVGIAISPEHQGHGIARRALDAALAHLGAAGVPAAVAEVHEANAASLTLFRRCGFREVPETPAPFVGFAKDRLAAPAAPGDDQA